ncbi:MAG: GNAT family N-acetyltransferase, partial [Acidobacteriota bacterium]
MTRRADAISRSEAPPSPRHVWLADRPEAAETVAAWTHDVWGRAAGRSFDEEVALTRGFAGREPPMMLLALSDDTVVGSAALRRHEMPEYPDYDYWLSAVFVAPEARGRRIASSLV